MIVPCKLIHQVPIARIRWPHQAVFGQELQRPIDSGFRHAGGACVLVNLPGLEMSALMQGLQNGQALGGHTVAARPQRLGMLRNTGQSETPYCNFYQ